MTMRIKSLENVRYRFQIRSEQEKHVPFTCIMCILYVIVHGRCSVNVLLRVHNTFSHILITTGIVHYK
jgi:hypothetical protein